MGGVLNGVILIRPQNRFYGEIRKFITLLLPNEPRCEKKGLRGFPTRSDTNRAVQLQKMSRGMKFWI